VAGVPAPVVDFIRRHRDKPVLRQALWVRRQLLRPVERRANAALFRAFLRDEPRRLHLGAGPNRLPGWLNTDLYADPRHGLARLDTRERFPLPDDCCDLVFSEHMIEHLTFAEGQRCLRECRRVLKPRGIVRVATPDLQRIARVAFGEEPWYLDEVAPHLDPRIPPLRGFVVNHQLRGWGHLFIYDLETLTYALESSGFAHVRKHDVGESDDPALRGIERHGENIGHRWNRYETLVVEARA
jgi:predicted SAM-dependent methyltransferase